MKNPFLKDIVKDLISIGATRLNQQYIPPARILNFRASFISPLLKPLVVAM
jgi:hypothetical protein